ncbi:MAG: nuclear transport factor 2 family protein [Cyanobacteria bacterium P01_A01_bin.114]
MGQSASDIIRAMYDAINRRDVEGAIAFIDDNCIYQDFNFSRPFQGKAAVRDLFKDSCEKVPKTLRFVIDDITTGDPLAAGLTWHVELDGIPFPNGRGTSFYRLSETTGKVIFARDTVEPPLKPGQIAFSIIRLVSPLVRKFLKHG